MNAGASPNQPQSNPVADQSLPTTPDRKVANQPHQGVNFPPQGPVNNPAVANPPGSPVVGQPTPSLPGAQPTAMAQAPTANPNLGPAQPTLPGPNPVPAPGGAIAPAMAPGINQVTPNPSVPANTIQTPMPPATSGAVNPAPVTDANQLAKMVADQAVKTPAKGSRKLAIIAGICALLALVVMTMVVVQQLR